MAESRALTDRMVRAARLDVNLYEEVEADTTANWQAFAAVVIVSLATGIGTGISGVIGDDEGALSFLWGLLTGLGVAIVGWLLWALFAYWVGTTIFKVPETKADYGQLLRTLGFANSPGILRFFSFVPYFGSLIAFVASIWILIAGVIAVRQALDFSTWRAIGTCIVGWIAYMVLLWVLLGLLAVGVGFLF